MELAAPAAAEAVLKPPLAAVEVELTAVVVGGLRLRDSEWVVRR